MHLPSQAHESPSEDRLDVLGRSLFAQTGSPGVHGRTALFESVIDGLSALITRHREAGTEVLRFPPVMSRSHVEKAGYLASFPHLLGCVCGLTGDDARYPRGARPLRRRARLDRRAEGDRPRAHARGLLSALSAHRRARRDRRRADISSMSRHTASGARRPTRSIASRPSACANSCAWARPTLPPISATAGWRARRHSRRASRLPHSIAPASDPFFGRTAKLIAQSQLDQALEIRAAHSRALGRATDRLHELQLPPRPLLVDLRPRDCVGRGRAHRMRRLRHGPAGARTVRDPRPRHRALAAAGAREPGAVERTGAMAPSLRHRRA